MKVGDKILNIFSILPQYLPNNFTIRSSDNVLIRLDLRISYKIAEPKIFAIKPLEFVNLLNWTQNELLDLFSKKDFKEFLKTYTDIAFGAIVKSQSFFNEYGIEILDIQIINYKCDDETTQKLLETDIITNITKQNQLKAKEKDVEIMKHENIIIKEKKDLEFVTAQKDNEIALKKKELEMELRTKEVELQIIEEEKRTDLLRVKRNNAVMESEFEGQSQGRSIDSFLRSLPNQVTLEQKLALWMELRNLDKSAMIYSKVQQISMLPPGCDLKQFNITVDKEVKTPIDNPMIIPQIMGYDLEKK